MYCLSCGNPLAHNAKFCTHCGAKVEEEQSAPQIDKETDVHFTQNNTANVGYAAAPQYTPPRAESMTRKEFYDRYASKKTKSWVTAMVIVCFFTAGVSLIMLFMGNYLSVLDVIFYAVMGGLLLSTRNAAFALIPTIYSAVFSLIALANGASAGGYLALIAGIMSIISLNKINKAYQIYQSSKALPDGEI